MYVWKFKIEYADASIKTDWICMNAGETIKEAQSRVGVIIDKLEADSAVSRLYVQRRTMPGI
jgi:hypothetical protein